MRTIAVKTAALVVVAVLYAASAAFGGEVRVMTSGAFTAAYLELVPEFERATKTTVVTTFGGSLGSEPTAIPNRLQRGEPADVVIMAATALDDLIAGAKVVAGSRVDLVRSAIGMAVRAGAPKPDISSVAALTQTLLDAKSIGYSASASGVYLTTELFPRLGIADQVMAKSRNASGERVGALISRGDVEIGFQQVSELLPEKGIDYVGPLPDEVQRITVFSAGIVVGATEPDAARALVAFLASAAARAVIKKTGLEPITSR
jgi:molybdate transport system substrate-binding protein